MWGFLLSALYSSTCWKRVWTLLISCILDFATLSLCFRAEFAHFWQISPHLFHSIVFVTCDEKGATSKCIYPKEPSCDPVSSSVITCKNVMLPHPQNFALCVILLLYREKEATLLRVDGRINHVYRTVYLISCFFIWLCTWEWVETWPVNTMINCTAV